MFFLFWGNLGWSQVELKEMTFQLLLEDWQGSSVTDGGGKIIPPARNGERECSEKWFWASLRCFGSKHITLQNFNLHTKTHKKLLNFTKKVFISSKYAFLFVSLQKEWWLFITETPPNVSVVTILDTFDSSSKMLISTCLASTVRNSGTHKKLNVME